jgi:hypothetical protein
VTVGHLQTLTASEKVLDTAGIDFSNIHHYGEVGHLRSVLKMIDRRFENKSFSLGEFGSKIAHGARNNGAWGDPAEDSVRHYLAVGHYALGMGASFTANWSWKDFRDSVFPWGVNHADLTPKPVLEAYRNMMLLFRTAEPRYEPPSLYLVLPDSFRLGPESARIHEGLRRATDALLRANVAFGVINEESLDRLPAAAQALVWPLAVCPSDATFGRVVRFVEKGGRLLLTGDPRFDESRKPTRLDRLERLGFPPVPDAPKPPFAWALSDAVNVVQSTNGRVMWIPVPVELLYGEDGFPHREYRHFLDTVSGVSRLKVSGDDGKALAFDIPLRSGRAVVAVNATDVPSKIVIAEHAGCPEISGLASVGRTLYVQFDAQGRVVAAASSRGLSVAGKEILQEQGDWALLSLDGKELRESAQVLAMPFGAGNFGLVRAAGAPALVGEVGEFRSGKWTPLEAQKLETADGAVRGVADAVTAYDLRLLAVPEQVGDARAKLERLLRVRR